MRMLRLRILLYLSMILCVVGFFLIGPGSEPRALLVNAGRAVWPNQISSANSDIWLRQHHDQITQLRPRILALNFVNGRSMSEMRDQLAEAINMFAEGSRYRGYRNPLAYPFIQYQLVATADFRDRQVPENWSYRNSTAYPRENPQQGAWSFDYAQLFTPEFAEVYNIHDRSTGKLLGLCELFEQGVINEVWIYGDADISEEVDAAEILERKPFYDQVGNRIDQPMTLCAGNGCFDEDEVNCRNTVRIAWFNNTRGPGCFIHSLSHGIERMATSGAVPYLKPYFSEFAGFDFQERYDLPFPSWYHRCPVDETCLSYPSETSVEFRLPQQRGRIEDSDPVCGNVHFPPNATKHYDDESSSTVQTSCVHYRDGSGTKTPFTTAVFQRYQEIAPDCQGPWIVWWWQNFPGYNNNSRDDDNQPMHNWWPYLYY